MAELSWSEDQWNKVNDAVRETFDKASVASQFLLRYGPLSGSAEIVRNEFLRQPLTTTVSLQAGHLAVNQSLVNLTVNVELTSEQVADESLSNAMLAFRRAASILAQEEDRIVFEGYGLGPRANDSQFVANVNLAQQTGLADLQRRQNFFSVLGLTPNANTAADGPLLVAAVVDRINVLETNFNPGPFACVLGNTLFAGVHTPNPNLALPADTIKPLLNGGPLLRSGMLDVNGGGRAGIVVSLPGNAVDIVVGTPLAVQFLQRTQRGRFLFRVYERFALRIRDPIRPPMAGFRGPPSGVQTQLEQQQLAAGAARAAMAIIAQQNQDVPLY